MSIPKEVSGYDVIDTEETEFFVLDVVAPYNQTTKCFIVMWPIKGADGEYTGKSMATCFTSEGSTEKLRRLRDGVQELLDLQADLRAVKPKTLVKESNWVNKELDSLAVHSS